MGRIMAAALCLALVAGCAGNQPHVTMSVDHPVAMMDAAVDIRIDGLPAGSTVVLSAQTTGAGGTVWRSETTYRAAGGHVDVAGTAPVSGGYQGVDAMGPFWSMAPVDGDPDSSFFSPADFSPADPDGYRVTLTALVGGKPAASTTVTRRTRSPDVHRTELRPATAGLYGTYVAPATGTGRRPAVLAFGGSEGGALTGVQEADVLAAHGYPALGLAYFGAPGLPDSLVRIPLEYFANALRWLRAQPGVDPDHVLVLGISRGGEAALLVAAHFPDLVDGVVAAVPSSLVNPAPPDLDGTFDPHRPAWTLGGQPLTPALPIGSGDPTATPDPATVIPVERIHGPVLAIAGGADRLWPSASYAKAVMDRLDADRFPYPHENLTYPGAGHGVGVLIPYAPAGGTVERTRFGTLTLGGSRTANARALEDVWPRVLAFIAG